MWSGCVRVWKCADVEWVCKGVGMCRRDVLSYLQPKHSFVYLVIFTKLTLSVCVSAGVSIGGEPACYIIENHLSRFVEGQDPSSCGTRCSGVL